MSRYRPPNRAAAKVPLAARRNRQLHNSARYTLSKVPEITLGFWVIKIAATTLGETGGDALSMTMQLGYAVSTFIFMGFFIVVAAAQIGSRRFRPFLYWAVTSRRPRSS